MKDKYDVLLCPPDLRGNERAYIDKCLEDSWVSTSGPFVEQFEKQLAELLKRKFAIATSSGTAALELCLTGSGVGKGITSSFPTGHSRQRLTLFSMLVQSHFSLILKRGIGGLIRLI